MPGPMDAAVKQQVIDSYRAGYTAKEIAQETGLSRNTVYYIAQRAGVTKGYGYVSKEEAQRRMEMYQEIRARSRTGQEALETMAHEGGYTFNGLQKWFRQHSPIAKGEIEVGTERRFRGREGYKAQVDGAWIGGAEEKDINELNHDELVERLGRALRNMGSGVNGGGVNGGGSKSGRRLKIIGKQGS